MQALPHALLHAHRSRRWCNGICRTFDWLPTGDMTEFMEKFSEATADTVVYHLPEGFRSDDSACSDSSDDGCTEADVDADRARFPFREFPNHAAIFEITKIFQVLPALPKPAAAAADQCLQPGDVQIAGSLGRWKGQVRPLQPLQIC